MLNVENLFFRYNPSHHWVLENLSFELAPGEIVGVQGSSGCGKTTFGNVLSGYLKPVKGRVSLDGNPLPKKGFCPVQTIFQHPELSINPYWKMEKLFQEVEEYFNPNYLEAFGIDDSWMNRYVHELSGGELQRICVARTLMTPLRYLICDEMTGMHDTITQVQIWKNLIEIVKKKEIGILVFSHDRTLMERVCDRIIPFEELQNCAVTEK
jgi:peptide/nickel transport system ATP-binding protein